MTQRRPLPDSDEVEERRFNDRLARRSVWAIVFAFLLLVVLGSLWSILGP